MDDEVRERGRDQGDQGEHPDADVKVAVDLAEGGTKRRADGYQDVLAGEATRRAP